MTHVSDVVISPHSAISLHAQLYSQLRQLIVSGRWAGGARLPSESQFSEHLDISRSTVRLALHQAEAEGLIERIAGRGSFVRYQPRPEHGSRLITFLTSSFDVGSHLHMLRGAENEVKAHGYQISFNHVQSYQEELEILQQLQAGGSAGVLLWPNAGTPAHEPGIAALYQQLKLPLVLLDRPIPDINRDCVTSNNYAGALALMEHLIGLGHRHIVFLTHHETGLLPVQHRYRAYCDVLAKVGLTPAAPWLIGQPGNEIDARNALQLSFNSDSDGLQEIKQYFLQAQPRPTAIFALHDHLAVLTVRALEQLGVAVPDHVSIGGFDDTDPAIHLEIPLTTVAQDPFMIGKEAARLLIGRIEGASEPARLVLIPTQLHIRKSTAVPVLVRP